MSERPSPASTFAERWSWLRPELGPPPGGEAPPGAGMRRWPDLGAAGRARQRELLEDARRRLGAESSPPGEPAAGRRRLALRLLDRELAELDRPPARDRVAALAAERLGAALEAGPACCLDHLERLPELTEPLFADAASPPCGDAAAGSRAALRLDHLARHLERRLEQRAVAGATAAATRRLRDLGARLAALPDVPVPADDSAWDELARAGWQLGALQIRLEEELARVHREAARRAELLAQRFRGAPAPEEPLAFVLGQLALDPPRPEQWSWQHERLQVELARWLARLGLEAELPRVATAPGLAPGWPDPACARDGRTLLLGDLSLLQAGDLDRHLGLAGHALPPLLAAREGLPGRAWALARARAAGQAAASADDGEPARSVIAVLLRPGDLEAWARWAGEWAVRRGWQAGDARVRLQQSLLEERDLLLARADLERRLAIRPDAELRRRLAGDGRWPEHVLDGLWEALAAAPGRQARDAALLLTLREAGRRWRRARRGAGAADWFHVAAECAAFPLDWLRAHLAEQPAAGRAWRPQPPALVRPPARADGLLNEVEERLAALGRIRREDLEAGREFDGEPPAPPVAAPEADEDDAPAE